MQSLLLLKLTEDGPVDRLINLDLLSSAGVSPDNPEWTRMFCGNADITMHIPFTKFLQQVENLISENYRISTETSAKWHNKRIADTEEMMRSILTGTPKG